MWWRWWCCASNFSLIQDVKSIRPQWCKRTLKTWALSDHKHGGIIVFGCSIRLCCHTIFYRRLSSNKKNCQKSTGKLHIWKASLNIRYAMIKSTRFSVQLKIASLVGCVLCLKAKRGTWVQFPGSYFFLHKFTCYLEFESQRRKFY
jgi:hypothetical protein